MRKMLCALLLIVLYVWLRWPLLSGDALFQGWNSDHLIFGLMAKEMILGEAFPIFFYGQNYMGPGTSMMAVFFEWLFRFGTEVPGFAGSQYDVSPATLRLGSLTFIGAGILFFGLAIKRLYGDNSALFVSLFLVFGSTLLYRASVLPRGTDMAFLGGALILFIATRKKRSFFALGLAAGIMWWWNQIIVFALLPVGFYHFAKTPLYKTLRHKIDWKDLLWNRRGYTRTSRILVRSVHFVLGINLLVGIVVSLLGGINTEILSTKIKIGNGFSPIKSSLILFCLLHFLIWSFKYKHKSIDQIKGWLFEIRFLALGFIIGYSPVWLGKILGWYPPGYGITFQFVSIFDLPAYWWRIFSEFFAQLISFEGSAIWGLAFVAIIFTTLTQVKRSKKIKAYLKLEAGDHGLASILWGIAYFFLVYLFLAERARDQFGIQYAVLLMPLIATIPVLLLKSGHKRYAWATGVLVLVFFARGAYNEYQSVKKAPLPYEEIIALRDSGYKICYANFWDAYRLEFLTNQKVRFIPYQSQDRTPQWTAKRKANPAEKCLYQKPGKITRFSGS